MHLIAGIAWIGASFYFVGLDNTCGRPSARDADDGVGGELWAIHGGGFYRVQKYRVAPRRAAPPLHWFKWEAYSTWLSGFALLVVLYCVATRTSTWSIAASPHHAAAGGGAQRRAARRAAGSCTTSCASGSASRTSAARRRADRGRSRSVAWGLSHVFSGRAMYIQSARCSAR